MAIMTKPAWQDILLPPGNEDQAWELFHENSKIGRHTRALPNEEVRRRMQELHESLPFEGYPIVELPETNLRVERPLSEAITARVSVRQFRRETLTLEQAAALLYHAYGITRDNKETSFPRPFRVVPSGGALYPLEIFFHSSRIEGLQPGLFHYNPTRNHLRLLREGDASETLSHLLVQPEVSLGASLIVFLTAVFERSIFKYGDRGYRFIFLEAGHVAQNLNLVGNALGLGCLNIGGYFDREVDDFLGLDGLTHSTIYLLAIGKPIGMS
jgi:SagB-type dehydrogenase family enzyme